MHVSLPDNQGIVQVTFRWHNRHGACYECGCPAAFMDVAGMDENHLRLFIVDYPHRKLCAVCAANCAAEGGTIARIEPFDDE